MEKKGRKMVPGGRITKGKHTIQYVWNCENCIIYHSIIIYKIS